MVPLIVAEVGVIAVALPVLATGSPSARAAGASRASNAQVAATADAKRLIVGLNTSATAKSRAGSAAQMWYIGAPAERDSASAISATVDPASTARAAWAASANTPVASAPTGPSSSSTSSSTVMSPAGR